MAKVKILFVCVGNCVRSQMAEALAKHYFPEIIEAESAGLHPLGFIDPTARAVVEERGVSMEGQFSKGLHNHRLENPDLIVNMSGLPGAQIFQGRTFEDWAIADPFCEDIETHRHICDDIEVHLKQLAARLRDQTDATKQCTAGA